MKTLDLNQMEKLRGSGDADCYTATSLGAIVLVAGALTGGIGWLIGAAGAYIMNDIGC